VHAAVMSSCRCCTEGSTEPWVQALSETSCQQC